MDEAAILALIRGLQGRRLRAWCAVGWVRPRSTEAGLSFTEADLARARLIHEMEEDLGLGEEAVPVILSLLDQIHGLRHSLRALAGAVLEQPEDVRRRIVSRLGGGDADE